jgi:hypothetical protein
MVRCHGREVGVEGTRSFLVGTEAVPEGKRAGPRRTRSVPCGRGRSGGEEAAGAGKRSFSRRRRSFQPGTWLVSTGKGAVLDPRESFSARRSTFPSQWTRFPLESSIGRGEEVFACSSRVLRLKMRLRSPAKARFDRARGRSGRLQVGGRRIGVARGGEGRCFPEGAGSIEDRVGSLGDGSARSGPGCIPQRWAPRARPRVMWSMTGSSRCRRVLSYLRDAPHRLLRVSRGRRARRCGVLVREDDGGAPLRRRSAARTILSAPR